MVTPVKPLLSARGAAGTKCRAIGQMNENTCGNPTIFHQDLTTFVTLNQPEKCNVLSVDVWRNIPALLKQAAARNETRVVVLRGAGGNFAADADITEFDSVLADRATARVYVQIMGAATAAIEALPIPVIAILEGQCVGAAVSLALACDIRLASTSARFAMTSAKLGLVYPFADTKRLVDTVGISTAKDLLFTGRIIDAARALEIGLIDDALDPTALDLALAERIKTHWRGVALVNSFN